MPVGATTVGCAGVVVDGSIVDPVGIVAPVATDEAPLLDVEEVEDVEGPPLNAGPAPPEPCASTFAGSEGASAQASTQNKLMNAPGNAQRKRRVDISTLDVDVLPRVSRIDPFGTIRGKLLGKTNGR